MAKSITTPDSTRRGGLTTVWREVWVFVLEVLREAYWLFDKDAKVRSQGLQTVGHVVRTQTREHTDSEGLTWETHHVIYEYQIDGSRYMVEKQVGSLAAVKPGVPIRVYFLPGAYPPRSAIDRTPRALAEREEGVSKRVQGELKINRSEPR